MGTPDLPDFSGTGKTGPGTGVGPLNSEHAITMHETKNQKSCRSIRTDLEYIEIPVTEG